MSEHRKLIADLQVFKEMAEADGYPTDAKIIERAIAALRGIQPKTDEPKIDADATLRNQFAVAALTGVLANPNSSYQQIKHLLNTVFLFADEAVAESKKLKE